MQSATKRKPGRPKGSRNAEVPVVKVQPSSVCPRCGSGELATIDGSGKRYWNRRTMRFGQQVIVWRTCRCRECGQVRVEKSYEQTESLPPAAIAAQ